jgi:hypothetical protein
MRVIIAGSRGITSYLVVDRAVELAGFDVTEVVSGTAAGVDRLGEAWASDNGVPVKKMPADWKQYGRRAGYLRNVEMAEYGDALIAIWDGGSRGTKHMIDIAKEHGLKFYIYIPDDL